MASVDDIRLLVTFPHHPKRALLRRRLGVDGVLALVDLWCWAGGNKPHGDLGEMTDEEIEIAAGWEGDAGILVATLRELRFLDGNRLHHWAERQGWAAGAERRSEAARVAGQASARARKASTEFNDPLNGIQRPVERPVNAPSTPLLSSPLLSRSKKPDSRAIHGTTDPDPGQTHALPAPTTPRPFNGSHVEQIYTEVTQRPAHTPSCAPIATEVTAAAKRTGTDVDALFRRCLAAWPDYRAHVRAPAIGWNVRDDLRGVEAQIGRLLAWVLDGEKPIPKGSSNSSSKGDSRAYEPGYRTVASDEEEREWRRKHADAEKNGCPPPPEVRDLVARLVAGKTLP